MTNHAEQNAQAWADSIHLAALALDEDNWDRFEELSDDAGPDDAAELAELQEMAAEYTDADDARDKAAESVLGVTLTGEWTPGEEPTATGYIILLSTGGPTLRIVGDLDRGEPTSVTLEYQDWGTPWTPYRGVSDDDLVAFVSCFYFGE